MADLGSGRETVQGGPADTTGLSPESGPGPGDKMLSRLVFVLFLLAMIVGAVGVLLFYANLQG